MAKTPQSSFACMLSLFQQCKLGLAYKKRSFPSFFIQVSLDLSPVYGSSGRRGPRHRGTGLAPPQQQLQPCLPCRQEVSPLLCVPGEHTELSAPPSPRSQLKGAEALAKVPRELHRASLLPVTAPLAATSEYFITSVQEMRRAALRKAPVTGAIPGGGGSPAPAARPWCDGPMAP